MKGEGRRKKEEGRREKESSVGRVAYIKGVPYGVTCIASD